MTRYRAIILIGYLALALAYGAINPLFEAPDEYSHYFTALYIKEKDTLPQVENPVDKWMGQEAAQPPLYYVLASVILRPFDTDDIRTDLWFNRGVNLGDASTPININRFIHTDAEAFPWHGWALSAHVLRAVSTFIGLATLIAIAHTADTLFPHEKTIGSLALTLVGFLPQFIFLHSYINNDVLVIFLSSWVVMMLVRLMGLTPASAGVTREEDLAPVSFLRRQEFMHWLGVGVVIGLAMLSKTAGILLLIFTFCYIVWLAMTEKGITAKNIFYPLSFILFPSLLISSWLFLRNWRLYGDITAANQFVAIAGGDRGASLLDVLRESSSILYSAVGVFGWFNVRSPEWVFWLWTGIITTALIGLIIAIVGTRLAVSPKIIGLLGWPLLVYLGLVQFMLRTEAAQGRLLFPAIGVLGIVVAVGWGVISGKGKVGSGKWNVAYGLLSVVCFASSLAGLQTIRQAYIGAMPVGERVPELVYEREVTKGVWLVGADLPVVSIKEGETLPLTLYWQADREIERNEAGEIVIELFGRGGESVGKTQGFQGRGLTPASLWDVGEVMVSETAVTVSERMRAPTQARVNVKSVGGMDQDIGFIKIVPEIWADELENEVRLSDSLSVMPLFEGGILTGDAGESISVPIRWEIRSELGRSYTTLVHIGAVGETPVAVGDAVAMGGSYPTHFWGAGERFDDAYLVVLPSDLDTGKYPIQIGLYDADLNRYPIEGSNTGTVVIGAISVEK